MIISNIKPNQITLDVIVIKQFYIGDRYNPIVVTEGTEARLRVVNKYHGAYNIIINGTEYVTDFDGEEIENFLKLA